MVGAATVLESRGSGTAEILRNFTKVIQLAREGNGTKAGPCGCQARDHTHGDRDGEQREAIESPGFPHTVISLGCHFPSLQVL